MEEKAEKLNIQDPDAAANMFEIAKSICPEETFTKPIEVLGDLEATLERILDKNKESQPSPKTPSSMFNTSVMQGCTNCPIKAFVMCYWDNILGPRIAHVWLTQEENNVPRAFLNMIATQTLNGEIARNPTDPNIDTKYFSNLEHGMVVSAYVFSAANRGDLGIHSLSMLISTDQRANLINNLCDPWIKRLVAKLKIFIEKESDDEAMLLFTAQLQQLAQMLQSLKDAGLPRDIPMCDSLFHWEHRGERPLICKALTAHLLTGGRSLVIGPTASQVNLMISSLALFLPENERLCCRYVTEHKPLPYHPDLPVQGLLQNASCHLGAWSLREVALSTRPTALIDLNSKQAKISNYIHKHCHARHRALYEDTLTLWNGGSADNYPTSDLFFVPDDPQTLVTELLDDMELLPPSDGLREHFVNTFVRMLEKRAFALISYVKDQSAKTTAVIKRKKLRQDLGISLPGDFKMVLAAAERLTPGIYGFVYRDRIGEYVACFEHVALLTQSSTVSAFT